MGGETGRTTLMPPLVPNSREDTRVTPFQGGGCEPFSMTAALLAQAPLIAAFAWWLIVLGLSGATNERQEREEEQA
jgi:hypothetical protein